MSDLQSKPIGERTLIDYVRHANDRVTAASYMLGTLQDRAESDGPETLIMSGWYRPMIDLLTSSLDEIVEWLDLRADEAEDAGVVRPHSGPWVSPSASSLSSPDANLIDLCGQFVVLEHAAAAMINGSGEPNVPKRLSEPFRQLQRPLLDKILALRATTEAGFRARAEALLAWCPELKTTGWLVNGSGWDQEMIVALLRDLAQLPNDPLEHIEGPQTKPIKRTRAKEAVQ